MNKYKNHSLTTKLSFGYSFIIFILLAILFAYNLYSIQNTQEQVMLSNNRTLSVYTDQISREFSDTITYIIQLQKQSHSMFQSDDPEKQYFDKSTLYNDFNYTLIYQKMVNGYFVYNPTDNDFFYTHLLRNTEETYQHRVGIGNYLETNIPDNLAASQSYWSQAKIGDTWYLIYQSWKNQVCYGGWISSQSILNIVNPQPETDDNLIFPTFSEEDILSDNIASLTGLTWNGNFENYILSTHEVTGYDFSLSMISKKKSIMDTLNTTLKVFLVLSVLSVLSIPLCHLYFRKLLYLPFQNTLAFVKKIEMGNLDYKAPDTDTPKEFWVLNDALYHMSLEIKNLKINIYEEQLQKKDIQLQYLQYQIKPHFILNIVNSISLMAQMGECDQIIETATYLSKYTRNMLKTDTSPDTLAKELEHLESYLHLQKMRFPQMITCQLLIPEEFKNLYIPTMMIQTFVENIFKHALDLYEPLAITLQARWEEPERNDGKAARAVFLIRDNGPGFPEDFLKNFNYKLNQPVTDSMKHVGIRNVANRLYLSYGKSASISLYNQDGAVVEIRIPAS